MRITLAASDLHDALKQSAIANRTPLDALTHARIATGDGGVVVEATDLTARTRIEVPADVVQPGSVLIEGARLLAIASGGGTLTLSDEGTVLRGRSRFTLGTQPVHDFPEEAAKGWQPLDVDAGALAAAIAQVEHAPNPNAIHSFCKGVVVADGYVYGADLALIAAVAVPYTGPTLIVPAAAQRHLAGLLHESATLEVGNVRGEQAGLLRITSGNTTVTITLVDGKPLGMRDFLDSKELGDNCVVLQRKALVAALRAFQPFVVTYGKGDSGVILQRADGRVWIADNAADAPNREDITAVVESADADFTVGMSHRLLVAALGAITTDTVRWYPDAKRPNYLLPAGDANRYACAHLVSPQSFKA